MPDRILSNDEYRYFRDSFSSIGIIERVTIGIKTGIGVERHGAGQYCRSVCALHVALGRNDKQRN
jgi:hypothetical protein